VIVMLHGCTQDAAEFAAAARMNALAAAAGAIVVYPEQPAAAHPQKCWNWYLPAHQTRDTGEPAIIAAIAREVVREQRADPRRVHVGGLSAGGAMAVLVALAYPDEFASVATHSGIGWGVARDLTGGLAAMKSGGPDPDSLGRLAFAAMGASARAVPVFVMHGTADAVVTPEASRRIVAQFRVIHTAAGKRTTADSERGTANGYSFEVVRERDAKGRVLIEAWFVDSLGHALAGGAPGSRWTDPRGPEAAREMLRFFLEHPRADR
jgi:poly(hydroxyalkanoate) depolymerase family esterase